MRNQIVLLFIFSLFTTFLTAQNFEKLSGPYGGGSKVFEGKNGMLFQFTNDSRTFYRSQDGGVNWKIYAYPSNSSNANISIGADGSLFFVTFNQIYRSSNNGQSWSLVNLPSGVNSTSAYTLQNGTLLLYAESQIYWSVDNGQNWTLSNFNGSVSKFFSSKQMDWVFAISSDKLYLSKDSGKNWSLFYQDDFIGPWYDFAETSNSNIFISGLEYIWRFDTSSALLLKSTVKTFTSGVVHMCASSSDRIFAFEKDASYYSDDLGASWKSFPNYNSITNVFSSFSFCAGSIFGIRVGGSLYRSVDNGQNWLFSAYGMMEPAEVGEMDFYDKNKFVAWTSDGLFYTIDGGKTWNLQHLHSQSFYAPPINSTAILGNQLFFVTRNGFYSIPSPNASPEKISHPIFDSLRKFSILINPKSTSIFIFEEARCYKSTDNGKSWKANALNGILHLYAFGNGSMVAVTKNSAYLSEDDGDQWTKSFDFPQIIQPGFNLCGNGFYSVYLMANDRNESLLYYSDDNGKSWSRHITIHNPNILFHFMNRFTCNNLSQLFATDEVAARVYASKPDRTQFDSYGDYLPGITGLDMSPDQKLYISTAGSGLYRAIIPTSTEKVMTGFTYHDNNKNCNYEINENAVVGSIVRAVSPGGTNYTISNSAGSFFLPISSSGIYTLEVNNRNNYWTSCSESVNASTYNPADTVFLGVKVNTLCPYMEVDIQSNIFRRCFEANIAVSYFNSGTTIANDAYIEVELDSFLVYTRSSIPLAVQQGNRLRFDIGDVPVNGRGFFSIHVLVSCDASLGQEHCVEAHIYPDSLCVPSSVAKIKTSAECLGDSVKIKIENIGTAAMSSSKQWELFDLSANGVSMQSVETGSFLLRVGEKYSKTIVALPRMLFIAEHDDLYPQNKYSQTEIISCSAFPQPGDVPLRITNLDEDEDFVSKFCLQNRGSFDPNDITGYPVGLTDRKYIDPRQELEYIIRFQNTGTDTAFTVRIENLISKDKLDLGTWIPGAASHPYSYLLNENGKLIISFSNIHLPDSNINEQASHGFFQYRIRPNESLPLGQKILNQAEIFFDFNEGVITNTEFHTLGYTIPVTTSDNDGHAKTLEWFVYPNPVNTGSKVILDSPFAPQQFYVDCYDFMNRRTGNTQLVSKGEWYSLSGKEAGMYTLQFKDHNGVPIGLVNIVVGK